MKNNYFTKNTIARMIYGAGMLIAAIGFLLPMLNFGIFGTVNGFQLAKTLGKFKDAIQFFLIAMFVIMCIAAVVAFIPNLQIADWGTFGLFILNVIIFLINLGAFKNSGKPKNHHKSNFKMPVPDFVKDFGKNIAFNTIKPGFYLLIIGIIIAIVGIVLTIIFRKKKNNKK